jgi:hypothetical protein
MTDNMTSENFGISSWDALYIEKILEILRRENQSKLYFQQYIVM